MGPGVVEANIHIYEDGSAKGHSRVTLEGDRIEFSYEAGQVIYDRAGQFSRVELSGTGSDGRQPFNFTASVRPVSHSPDCVIWDITGGDVRNTLELHFEAEGTLKLESR